MQEEETEGKEAQARVLLPLQGLLLHITAGIKSGHRHAVSRIALHLSFSFTHTHTLTQKMCKEVLLSLSARLLGPGKDCETGW